MHIVKNRFTLSFVSLLVLGIFIYSISYKPEVKKVDKVLKKAKVEDKVCKSKIDNLLIILKASTSEKPSKKVKLSCSPKENAIKDITGNNNTPISFDIIKNNLSGGKDTFTCTKNGDSVIYNIDNLNQAASLTLIPKIDIPGEKSANCSATGGTCICKKEDAKISKTFSNSVGLAGAGSINVGIFQSIPGSINLEHLKNLYQITTIDTSKVDDKNERVQDYNPGLVSAVGPIVGGEKQAQINKYLLKKGQPKAGIDKTETTIYEPSYLKPANSYTFAEYENEYNLAPPSRKKETTISSSSDKVNTGVIDLYCNFDLTAEDIQKIEQFNRKDLYNPEGKISEYYYDSNNTYFFKAVQTSNVTVGRYSFNYNTGNKSGPKKGSEITCKKICTEIVKVEYGPPITSRAGLCFSYRVKASSIVNCETDLSSIPEVPKGSGKVCRPSPWCAAEGDYSYLVHQAGPKEDFEKCVKKCDGGKYTDKCSNKCYQKVYKKKGIKKTNSNNIPTLENVSYGSKCEPGQYFRTGNKIEWCSFPNQRTDLSIHEGQPTNIIDPHLAYWYAVRSGSYSINFVSDAYGPGKDRSGILRARQGSNDCDDPCWWSGYSEPNSVCEEDAYIEFDYRKYQQLGLKNVKCPKYKFRSANGTEETKEICNVQELMQADAISNINMRNQAVKACEAQTTCAQTTSTYSIEFKYKKQKTTTILKPYSDESDKDELKSKTGGNPFKRYNVLLSYGGCYGHNESKRWYQSEWTFPGTYQGYKGQNSFTNPGKANTSTFNPGLVCLPSDTYEPNEEWARKYFSLIDPKLTPITTPWNFDSSKKYENPNTVDGYNIKAKSNNFGHFKWDFTISCFYALSSGCQGSSCSPSDTCHDNNPFCCKDKECKTSGKEEYKNRSYNAISPLLKNEDTDRKIGFNWTKNAQLVKMPNGEYNIDPEKLAAKIKQHGTEGKTFSDEVKDYEYKLTPENIVNIRRYNKDNKIDTFEGTVDSVNGVVVYKSDFLNKSEYIKKEYGDITADRGRNNRAYQGLS